jgi:hypothetical protein
MAAQIRHKSCLLFILCLFSTTIFAADSHTRQKSGRDSDPTRPTRSAPEADQDSDDNPKAREEWFRSGRHALGEHSADLLNRAYEHKKVMRPVVSTAQDQALARQKAANSAPETSQSGQNSANGVPFSGTIYQGLWTNMGPAPIASDPEQDYGKVVGRLTAVSVDQGDATGNTVYIGAAFGGVWKSTNAANSDPTAVIWTPLLDAQPTLAVGAISIQPNTTGNNAVVLVGTGEPNSSGDSYYGMGILRSTDGGQTWTPVRTADNGAKTFSGLGASGFAWGTNGVVVVGMASTNGKSEGSDSVGGRGIYYSQDAGVTWHYALVKDPGGAILSEGSVTSTAYNPVTQKFYAFYRYHGFYESSDGANWTRSQVQPEATPGALLTVANCPTDQSTTGPNPTNACPLYRGQIAVRPNSGDMYVIYVDSRDIDQGVYVTSNGALTAWRQITSKGTGGIVDNSSTNEIAQGDYNLWLGAIPTAQGTDLLIGTRDILKCSLTQAAPDCTSWKNLTHVYTCNPIAQPSHVHPDQHGFDFNLSNPLQMYFANDGGVYRSLNGANGDGTCTSANPFDNLDSNLGSVSEMVSFSQHPTKPNVLLAGLQDNGSPALLGPGTTVWQTVNGSDGGYNEIDPNDPDGIWYTEYTSIGGLSIQQCNAHNTNLKPQIPNAEACSAGTFGLVDPQSGIATSVSIGPAQVPDSAEFYVPYTVDPANTQNLVIGTCRVWRGPGSGGSNWSPSNAISPAFDGGTSNTGTTDLCSGLTKIRALAVGGPSANQISKVIYVGLEGAGTTSSGTNVGQVWVNTNADTHTEIGPLGWRRIDQNAGIAATSNGGLGPYPIADIAIDAHDASGQTAYVVVEGFGVGHVWKTTDAGTSWTNLTNNLPDAPADSVVVDPDYSNVLYLGTDVGTFVSVDAGISWQILGNNLPNVPVTKMRVFGNNAAQNKAIRVSTYGRGLWQLSLAPAILSPQSLNFGGQLVNTTAQQTVALINNSGGAITGVGIQISGAGFSQTTDCTASLAPFTSCHIQVSFSPVATGQALGNLTVTDSAPNSPQSVALTGVGSVTTLSVSPGTLSFATIAGGTSAAQTVSVRNLGATAIAGISISISSPFKESDNCSAGIAAGGSCAIQVSFVPGVAGTPTGTLNVTDPASQLVEKVALNGSASDFAVTIGASGSSQTVNSGQSATFNLNVASIDGFNGSIALACSSGLPTGTSCAFNPATAAISGSGNVPVTLTISTAAHSSAQPATTAGMITPPTSGGPNQTTLLAFIFLAGLGSAICAMTFTEKKRPGFALACVISAASIMTACGGGGGGSSPTQASPSITNGTPAGTYNVVVTATSGNRTQTLQLTLKTN